MYDTNRERGAGCKNVGFMLGKFAGGVGNFCRPNNFVMGGGSSLKATRPRAPTSVSIYYCSLIPSSIFVGFFFSSPFLCLFVSMMVCSDPDVFSVQFIIYLYKNSPNSNLLKYEPVGRRSKIIPLINFIYL